MIGTYLGGLGCEPYCTIGACTLCMTAMTRLNSSSDMRSDSLLSKFEADVTADAFLVPKWRFFLFLFCSPIILSTALNQVPADVMVSLPTMDPCNDTNTVDIFAMDTGLEQRIKDINVIAVR